VKEVNCQEPADVGSREKKAAVCLNVPKQLNVINCRD